MDRPSDLPPSEPFYSFGPALGKRETMQPCLAAAVFGRRAVLQSCAFHARRPFADRGGRRYRAGTEGVFLSAEQSIELALEVSDFATVLQVGRSVLSGTAAALANDPQVQTAYLGAG